MLYDGYHNSEILKRAEVVWCIYKPCVYSSPALAKINYPFKDGYMITEYGFGETSKFIKESHIVAYGTVSELTNKLSIWIDMQNSINSTITNIENK